MFVQTAFQRYKSSYYQDRYFTEISIILPESSLYKEHIFITCHSVQLTIICISIPLHHCFFGIILRGFWGLCTIKYFCFSTSPIFCLEINIIGSIHYYFSTFCFPVSNILLIYGILLYCPCLANFMICFLFNPVFLNHVNKVSERMTLYAHMHLRMLT